jgi:hypothetical protein
MASDADSVLFLLRLVRKPVPASRLPCKLFRGLFPATLRSLAASNVVKGRTPMATKKSAAKKTSSKKKSSTRKYSPKAGKSVEREMKAFKQGKLKSGSGRKVTSRKQAIAIGLSEARKSGAKVPTKKSSS